MSRPQSGCCRRRAAVAEIDVTQSKGYTSRAERSAGFTKTKMCKFYLEGNCTRGRKCTFAHGDEDVDSKPQPLCMKLCKTLIATGRCKNQNCRYAHSKEQIASAKQLTIGLIDGQEHDVRATVAPSISECDHSVQEQGIGRNLNSRGPVHWLGFLRRAFPLRAPQRVVAAPPGVFEAPAVNSTAISYPVMQMTHSELPAAPQFDNSSLSIPSEPEFHVVVKNTFIDVVETSPRSPSRSQSEPPRFMSKDVETRHRCLSSIGDVAEIFGEQQQFPVSDSSPEIATAPATQVAESSLVERQQVSASILQGSTPLPADGAASVDGQRAKQQQPASYQVEQSSHGQHQSISDSAEDVTDSLIGMELSTEDRIMRKDVEGKCRCLSSTGEVAEMFGEQQFSVSGSVPEIIIAPANILKGSYLPAANLVASLDGQQVQEQQRATAQEEQSVHGQHLPIPNSVVDDTNSLIVSEETAGESSVAFARPIAFPAIRVRNTFIEVCQNLFVPGGLRRVRSAAGRLDQLAAVGEAMYQAHS